MVRKKRILNNRRCSEQEKPTWQVANGQFIRTHVDTTDPSLIAIKAMVELREELKDYVTIQIVAFPQEGILSYPNGLELLEEALN